LLLTVACACAPPAQALGAAELLDLGEKYLLEMNYAQAAVYFERLIEVEPRNPRGYTGLSEAHIGLGDAGGAVSALRDGFAKLRDDGEFIAELAEHYEGIIEKSPDLQDAYIGLADALLALGDDDGAADALRRGLEQLPDSRRIAAMLAELGAASEAESDDVANGTELGELVRQTTERQDADQWDADQQNADRQGAVRQDGDAQSELPPASASPPAAPSPALSPA
jgi:tetratricopeptide (TPR) repeat protein